MLDFLTGGVGLTVIIVIVALVLIMALVLSTWRKIPNDHAAVIVGAGKPKVVTGGGTMVIPLLQRMDMITLETLGLAEAEALEKKAEALAKMNEAGKLQMVMDILPEFARAVSEPMSRIGNVTVIGGGDDAGISAMTGSTVSALKAVTDAVKSTTGFDLTRVMEAQTIDAKTERNVHLDGAPLQVKVETESKADSVTKESNPKANKTKQTD